MSFLIRKKKRERRKRGSVGTACGWRLQEQSGLLRNDVDLLLMMMWKARSVVEGIQKGLVILYGHL